jgi:hypothetical protein
VVNGAKLYEHGYPDEDTARRVLAVKIGDLAAGRRGLKTPKPSGPLARIVEEWLKVTRTTHAGLVTMFVHVYPGRFTAGLGDHGAGTWRLSASITCTIGAVASR